MGFIAIEAGWTVTEVGRQPWIVYGVLRTADAVTPMPGLIVPFLGFTAALLLPRRDRGLAALPPDHPQPAAHRVEPDVRTCRDGAVPPELALADVLAALLALALNAYVLFGGADFGGGVWDLLASRAAARPPARGDRATPSARSGRRITSG